MTQPLPVGLAASAARADVASPPAPAVRAERLGKEIDGREVVHEATFDVQPGEFVGLLGANGAGKSTLLKMLAMLTQPTRGSLSIFGKRCRPEAAAIRAQIGLIGHGSMLYRDLSPLENLTFFARLYRVANPAQRAGELLDWLGLAGRAHDPVRTFSRGMVQRVAIARALVHQPRLLLADEPFTGLDAPSVAAIGQMLRDLRSDGRTIVLANHDIAQSLDLASRVLALRRGRLVLNQPAHGLTVLGLLREVSE